MDTDFLHGIETVTIDGGARPIQTVRASVIGIVGTAPDADAKAFPLNTPVLIAGSPLEATKLDTKGTHKGTLPQAMVDIFNQAGALVVVIRVEESANAATQKAGVIGGVDPTTNQYTGVKALLAANDAVKVKPKILIAPGFTHDDAVVTAMVPVANSLGAMIYADGPNTTDEAAKTFRAKFGSKRVRIFDPWVRVFDTGAKAEVTRPASAVMAGLRARVDHERGWWWSISNNEINGIIGTGRPVEFSVGDKNCRANLLNEKQVTTIIQEDGFRAWGNSTCSSDPKWRFEQVVRTADMIDESIAQAHLWAVDRNITTTYFADVTEGVNAYFRYLKTLNAILGGFCWVDKALNAADQIEVGHATFDYDFTATSPAERITFRSHLTNRYIKDLLP